MTVRKQTAHHEAGHVVLARAIGWVVEGTEFVNWQTAWTHSHPAEGEALWYEDVAIRLAGGVTESRYLNEPTDFARRAEDERDQAVATTREAASAGADIQSMVDALQTQVEDILSDEALWRAVEHVAAELDVHDRLKRAEVDAIVAPYLVKRRTILPPPNA